MTTIILKLNNAHKNLINSTGNKVANFKYFIKNRIFLLEFSKGIFIKRVLKIILQEDLKFCISERFNLPNPTKILKRAYNG